MDKKRLYSSFDTIFLTHVQSLLEQAGMVVEQRNQLLSGGVGELPFTEVTPELWVQGSDYVEAERILQQAISDANAPKGPDWVCSQCGETIEGQFAQCWHCGHWHDNSN